MANPKLTKVSVYIPERLLGDLEAISEATETSLAETIRNAVREFVAVRKPNSNLSHLPLAS
jgi:metal-responsive CopG/Arc/MetJ family transcriptional regulator